MNTFSTGLRALKHPATMVAIGILLINDHFLKAAAPSFLTGKISDFAGLFFFPFLLAAMFGLILVRWKISQRITGSLAFGITLLWFASIKTLPAANELTRNLLEWLLGSPRQIVLDPTDLLALVMLWPAWRLWQSQSQFVNRPIPGKLAYFALGLSALATMATSPCPEPFRVSHLAVDGQSVIASTDNTSYSPSILRSSDGGVSWADAGPLNPEVQKSLQQSVTFPFTLCDPQSPQICYRISQLKQVEQSSDGGQTWRIAWKEPWGRASFLKRQRNMPMACAPKLEPYPLDLAFIPGSNGSTLVVAMGYEGVLVHPPDGGWGRYSILSAVPLPYANLNLWLILPETLAAILVTGLVLIGSALWIWLSLARSLPADRRLRTLWPAIFLVLFPVEGLIVFLLFGRTTYSSGLSFIIWLLSFPALPVTFFVSMGVTWRRVAKALSQSDGLNLIRSAYRNTGWLVLAGLWLPFILWELGLIPLYELAIGVSLLAGAVIVWRRILPIKKLMNNLNDAMAQNNQPQQATPG